MSRFWNWKTFCIVITLLAGTARGAEEIKITSSLPDVSVPPSSTEKAPLSYGLGYIVQVGHETAALFCNLRTIGPKRWDHEAGTDVFLFDDLNQVGKSKSVSISWNEPEKDPVTGEARRIFKFPVAGVFWPLGAKRSDGSMHPGEGKGAAFCQAQAFPDDGTEIFTLYQPHKYYTESMQLSFDGKQLSVHDRKLIRSAVVWTTPDGWGICAPGLQWAIPDGDDLLWPVSAHRKSRTTGVSRFRYLDGQWRPVDFTPVADGSESSLVRRKDGSLLYAVRGPYSSQDETKNQDAHSILLYESTDGGKTWSQYLRRPNVVAPAPVGVHATPDGRFFMTGNPFGGFRERLSMWQLVDGAPELMPQQTVRDGPKEFGKAPAGYWFIDHATSAIVRLRDGRWHGAISYRVLDFNSPRTGGTEPILPQTGCYVEEMISSDQGPVVSPWRF